jgi:hypothetical protein
LVNGKHQEILAMALSMNELARAREVVGSILEELHLDAYMFEVEPTDRQWEIRVECAVQEGWETVRLRAARDYLLRGAEDAVAHQVLLDTWREALSACVRKA